jgi:hypothetical protein
MAIANKPRQADSDLKNEIRNFFPSYTQNGGRGSGEKVEVPVEGLGGARNVKLEMPK